MDDSFFNFARGRLKKSKEKKIIQIAISKLHECNLEK